jgi:hypothetical protein
MFGENISEGPRQLSLARFPRTTPGLIVTAHCSRAAGPPG